MCEEEEVAPLPLDAARTAVLAACESLGDESVPLDDALGRALAEDVVANHDVPPFAGSAMDGFAVLAGDADRMLAIVDEARAGHPAVRTVTPETAIRISPRAPIPGGATAVVPLEEAIECDAGTAVGLRIAVCDGENIRAAGEDVGAGDVVLTRGTRLEPAELGVAAIAGRATVACARRPRVAVLATGDELATLGAPLHPGQIHDANALTISALARRAGAEVLSCERVPDDRARTEAVLASALERVDVVLISGGVSVGPHDHVKPALAAVGVVERFWRVALKPGKPTWFGVCESPRAVLVFGLPGNPVSAMVTFLLFARPALLALQGLSPDAARVRARTAIAISRNPRRDEMVRVRIGANEHGTSIATPTGPQGSHVLSSMLGADGLARIPAGEDDLPAATEVEVELLA